MADILDIISKEQVDRLYSYLESIDALTAKVVEYNKTVTSSGEKAKVLADAQREAEKISKQQAATLAALDKQRQAAYAQQAKEAQQAYDAQANAAKKAAAEEEKAAKKAADALAKQLAKEKEMADAIAKEAKSVDELNAQNKALLAVRNKVDASTKQGQAEIKKINAQLERNTKEIKQNSNAMEKQRMNIGNYGSALKGVGTKLMGMAAAFGATIGAVEIFKGIINSSEASMDWFAKKSEGLKESMNLLARAIITMDFSNLIQGFRDAFREGERYAEVLDEIEDRERSLGIRKADIQGQILDQKKIAKAAWSTTEEKEAAIEEIMRLYQLERDETIKISEDKLQNELRNAAQITKTDEKLVADIISNYDQYIPKIEEASKLQEYLNSLITESTMVVGDQVMMVKNTEEYDKAIRELTPTQKELLDILRIENTIRGEKRDLIAAAIIENQNAINAAKEGELGLTKLRNSLYNELLNQEKEVADNQKQNAEDEKKQKEEYLKGLHEKHLAWMDETKQQEEFNNRAINAEEEIAKFTDDIIDEQAERDAANHEDEMKRIEEERQATIQSEEDKKQAVLQAEEEKKQKRMQTFQALADLGQTLLDFNQFVIDTETQRLEQQKQYELSLVGDNAAKKQAIERRYAEEEKKLKIKQAKQDKAQALFSAIIKTAQAVIAGLAFGPPLGYVFAALNAVLGGIQIGLIASQPLPQYAKGTKRARGGLAVVGEKGRELIMGPDGSIALSPSTASLVNLGRGGHRIIPNRETEALLRAARGADDPAALKMLNEIKAGNDRLVKAIQDKSEVHISRDGHRITERRGAYARTWYDKKVRI